MTPEERARHDKERIAQNQLAELFTALMLGMVVLGMAAVAHFLHVSFTNVLLSALVYMGLQGMRHGR